MQVTLLEATLAAAALIAVPAATIGFGLQRDGVHHADTVQIGAQIIDFPVPGEFILNGNPASSPVERVDLDAFRIARRQVSLTEYGFCVTAGACAAADAARTEADVPVTGVSWLDANAYARWYSEVSGDTWRLPTAVEAAAAAGERFGGEAFTAAAEDPDNPAVRWIRRYREDAASKRPADPDPKPRGHYGANALGIEDFGGNVWEWTSTCYQRVTLGPDRKAVGAIENCGVHVLEGRHRAYMSNFVRDGKSGGCAVGTPPENLGFRLVREETLPVARLANRIRALLPASRNPS